MSPRISGTKCNHMGSMGCSPYQPVSDFFHQQYIIAPFPSLESQVGQTRCFFRSLTMGGI